MTWGDALRLGRVSNLPTVWTNMLAGIVLAGGNPAESWVWPLLLALTLFYLGGMYLNDAFDAAIDAVERPERPIPSGRVSRATVFVAGFFMLAAGIALVAYVDQARNGDAAGGAGLAAVALAAAIVFYDWYHKANPLSPVVMGLCRLLVYLTAGLVFVSPPPLQLVIGGVLLLCYLIGLTYVAKQENLGSVDKLWPLLFLAIPVVHGVNLSAQAPLTGLFLLLFAGWMAVALWFIKRRGPGDIPRAVVSLLAGICLLDAMLIAGTGNVELAVLAVAGFVLTLGLQRFVPGT